MEPEAKAIARDKAQAISRKIGYPDMIYDPAAMAKHFKGTVANELDHFGNVLINSQVWAHRSLGELRDPFDKSKFVQGYTANEKCTKRPTFFHLQMGRHTCRS
jgi:predicted metalloendopeptidase